KKAGVQVAPYKVVTSSLDIENLDFSKTHVLKTATGGYDGHGQVVITSAADLEKANQLANSCECVLEEFVDFDLEISVIVSGMVKISQYSQFKKTFTAITFFQKP